MKFSKVRKPPSTIAAAIAAPAHSRRAYVALPLAQVIAKAFSKTRLTVRARMLRRLLVPVGPLALAVIAGGAFAKYVGQARWARLSVSLEDAANVTAGQVIELARYVEQSDPSALTQVLNVLAHDAATMAALGTSVAAIVFDRMSRQPILQGA